MFLANLSDSLLQICEIERLSYEQAAERCNCCSRHFANIVRKKSVPSINILEQICNGFHATPNQLFQIDQPKNEIVSFRQPMPVIPLYVFRSGDAFSADLACPRCGCTLEQGYQPFCHSCGQCLSWRNIYTAHEP